MQNNLELADNTLFLHARFLNSKLAGHTNLPTDSTNAMKSGVNLETGDWQEKLPQLNLPKVVSPGEIIGEINTQHCKRWGLRAGIKLVSGATDSNAAFLPLVLGGSGRVVSTIGTTLAIKGISQKELMTLMGVFTATASRWSLAPWWGIQCSGGEILREHKNELSVLENAAANVQFIPNSLVYPSVRIGERLPFLDANFKPFLRR